MARLNPHEVGLYLSKLVGTPWERKGMHCWRVVVKVQLDLFDRAIPFADRHMVNRDKLKELMGLNCEDYGWREIDAPEHGCVVRMYRQGADPKELIHAGVYLDIQGGTVLHSDAGHGVVLDSLFQISVQRGWMLRFFVPKDQ